MPSPLPPAGDPDHEIERKWLVTGTPPPLIDGIDRIDGINRINGIELLQGYLSDGTGGEVRVRRAGHHHTLTAKRGRGLVRQEVELSLTAAQFTALWPLTRGRRIHKTRYAIRHGEHTIDLDVYHGVLDGLCTAEIEFAGAAEAAACCPPDWFGAELTGEPGWSNGDLARHGRPG